MVVFVSPQGPFQETLRGRQQRARDLPFHVMPISAPHAAGCRYAKRISTDSHFYDGVLKQVQHDGLYDLAVPLPILFYKILQFVFAGFVAKEVLYLVVLFVVYGVGKGELGAG
jgi:hypothetical protein